MIIDAVKGAILNIGRLGENEAIVVRFDVSRILGEFPGAAFTVLNRRPRDASAYPVSSGNVELSGTSVLWTVTSADLSQEGLGECELTASVDSVIVKSEIWQTRIQHALDGAGEPPEPWESWVEQVSDDADRAEAAAELLENPGAEAETLEPGSSATASYSEGTFTFGIPQGIPGETGPAGADGKDGKDGKDGADGKDGKDGQDGAPGKDGKDGADGYTPVRGTDYWTAEDKAEIVADASATVENDIIDDNAGAGDTGKVWSADKSASVESALNAAITLKQDAPSSGAAAGKVLGLALVDGQLVPVWDGFPVSDVQVNGSSILSQGVANVPIASTTAPGVVKMAGTDYGLTVSSNNNILVYPAYEAQIKAQTNEYRPITSRYQYVGVFYGLATAAGDSTQKSSSNTIGTYTESAKSAISQMLDAPETVSGSTPSITAKAGIRYVCGEVSTLTIVVPASGIIDVTFESGSTATVLTVTPPTGVTMMWPSWFDPTALAANSVYEINIMGGKYGAVARWK